MTYSGYIVPRIKIQCVIVLYKNTLKESRTIRSLIDCQRQHTDLTEALSILIYDNSPDPQQLAATDLLGGIVEYYHDPQNGGLASAYNYALTVAQSRNIDWLLLLDQDTVVETDMTLALLQTISGPLASDVCAIVPKLVQNGVVLSPQMIGKFRNYSIDLEFSGLSSKPLAVLNSGSCLRVQALVDVGCFAREYWLDYLDHITFYRLQSVGGKVLVLDASIQHQLSLTNLQTEMSVERYKKVLSAEWTFVRETGRGGGVIVHRLRLLKRAAAHFSKHRNKAYAFCALRASFS